MHCETTNSNEEEEHNTAQHSTMSSSVPVRTIRQFKFAAVQLRVTSDKEANLSHVRRVVREAAQSGASVVALPECFNSPYGNKFFATYAESVPDGVTSRCLREIALENKVLLIGGSIPERDG
jgi:omega-amidase